VLVYRYYLSWNIRFVVWLLLWNISFFYMCNVNYSVFFLLISFYIYVCMPCVFHATETDNAAWVASVTVGFISLSNWKFPSYLLNVTKRFLMRFIRKCCVFHMYVTIAVGNGRSWSKLPRRRVHGAAQARCRTTLQVSNESSAVCS